VTHTSSGKDNYKPLKATRKRNKFQELRSAPIAQSNKTEFAEAWLLEQNPNFVPGVAKLRGQARTRKAQRSKGITK